jgi:nucleoside-diphosphate-sugar epimerase
LITGGAGYLGSHVVRRLLARGDRVRVLDTFLHGADGLSGVAGDARLTVVAGDVRDRAAVADAVAGADTVVALAAVGSDDDAHVDRDTVAAVNCDASYVLAEACAVARVKRLVFGSSCSVYGVGTDPLAETSTLSPLSFYARTRVDAERIVESFAGRLSVVTLRLPTLFGLSPRMRLDLLVNALTTQACFRRQMRVEGGGQWRPQLHVQDAATAVVLAADAPEPLVRGQCFNVGDTHANQTVCEIAAHVAAALPGTEVVVEQHARDARDYRVSFSKIRTALGFVPQHGVPQGIAEIVAACRRGEITTAEDGRRSRAADLMPHAA